jgi:FAD binding domain in molybdopterin dehydrogenase
MRPGIWPRSLTYWLCGREAVPDECSHSRWKLSGVVTLTDRARWESMSAARTAQTAMPATAFHGVEAMKMGGKGGATGTRRDPAQGRAPVEYLAGGTTLVDLIELDGVRPAKVVDLGAIAGAYEAISVSSDGVRLGALVKMSGLLPVSSTREPFWLRSPPQTMCSVIAWRSATHSQAD